MTNETEVAGISFQNLVEEARERARILRDVVRSSRLSVKTDGGEFLTLEAWALLGRAYGYFWKVTQTEAVDGGGWSAHCVVVDQNGAIVSECDSEAGTEGDSPWNRRPRYQQRSMAQSRAQSKALRSALGWVVVLADFSATPSDEMPPALLDPNNPLAYDSTPSGGITIAQRTRLFAIMNEAGMSETMMHARMVSQYQQEHTGGLTLPQYDELVEWIENNPNL